MADQTEYATAKQGLTPLLQTPGESAFAALVEQLLTYEPDVREQLAAWLEEEFARWPGHIPRHVPDVLHDACMGTPIFRISHPLDVSLMDESSRALAPSDFGDGENDEIERFAEHLRSLGLEPTSVHLGASDFSAFFPKRWGKVLSYADYCFHHGTIQLRGSAHDDGGPPASVSGFGERYLVLSGDLRSDVSIRLGADYGLFGLGIGGVLEAPVVQVECKCMAKGVRGSLVVLNTNETSSDITYVETRILIRFLARVGRVQAEYDFELSDGRSFVEPLQEKLRDALPPIALQQLDRYLADMDAFYERKNSERRKVNKSDFRLNLRAETYKWATSTGDALRTCWGEETSKAKALSELLDEFESA